MVPKQRNLVLFGAFLGNRYGDNSAAMYEFCVRERCHVWRCVWMANAEETCVEARGVGGEAYRKRSFRGLWLQLRAAAVVTSHGCDDVFLFSVDPKATKELYLHHGIPLRAIDRARHTFSSRALYDAHASSIHTMAASSIWGGVQQQKNIPVDDARICVTGYPRTDRLVLGDAAKCDELRGRFRLRSRVILYAPTWRKWAPTKFLPFPDTNIEQLVKFLDVHDATLVLRPHSVDRRQHEHTSFWKAIKSYPDTFTVMTMDDYANTEDLLLLADVLVTDYSSLFYDFLCRNRPMIFLPYDREDYERRVGGFLDDYDSGTPGPKLFTQEEFVHALTCALEHEDGFEEARMTFRQRAHAFTDGGSRTRVAECIGRMLKV
jgi:CDP-glycerol glycerophosphotransferase (TagB/SpsB family)